MEAVTSVPAKDEDEIYWRVYTYGKIGHLSYEGHIGQLYSESYEIIDNSVIDKLV